MGNIFERGGYSVRNKKVKIVVLSVAVLTMFFLLIGCSSPQKEGGGAAQTSPGNAASGEGKQYLMKIGHAMVPNGPRDRAANLFKEEVEKATNGRIKVQVYPASQLGDNKQMVEGLQLGTIEGVITPTAFLGGFHPLFTVVDLPFLFPTQDVADKILNGPVGDQLLKSAEEIGIRGLAFWFEGGFKQFSSNFPIKSPEDFKGHKIRTMDTPILIEQYRTWGATAVPVAFAELYNALQLGTVEGQENRLGTIMEMKLHEVQKYITISNHGDIVEIFMVSKKWFDSLPPDLQEVLVSTAKRISPTRRSWGEEQDRQALEFLKSTGKNVVYELTPAERERFKATAKAIYQKFGEMTGARGQEMLNKIQEEVARLSKA